MRGTGEMSQVHLPFSLSQKHEACVCVLMLSNVCLPADIHAVLLSDVLLLLQEKDQKLVFATVVSSSKNINQFCWGFMVLSVHYRYRTILALKLIIRYQAI